MAFTNITGLNLGKFLQIAFSSGVRNQISESYRDWEDIKSMRKGSPNGREHRFLFQTSFGPAAVQYRNPGVSSDFPVGQQITTSEHTAVFKEIDATIEIEYNVWKRARMSPDKYAEPLAREIMSKTVATKRQLAKDLYGDGTGVLFQAASASDAAIASGLVTVTVNKTDAARGFIGWCEFGDLVKPYALAGTAVAPTGGTGFVAYKIVAKNRKLATVTLQLVNSAGAAVTDATASNIVATNVFYRIGQPTIPNLTGAIADYGSITEVIPGLESLVAADGRVVHGITMSGASAGSVLDLAGANLDAESLREAMDNVKIAVGQGVYKWSKMCAAPEAIGVLIDSRETDRRFQTIEDNKRGIKRFAYVHGDDTLELFSSEFTPFQRMYSMPSETSGEGKVMELHMSDFEPVSYSGEPFQLKPSSSGGHSRSVIGYMNAVGTLICKHPAAVMSIRNFNIG